MLQKIGLVNQNGDRLMLHLARPNLSGILIKDIDGLGSVTSAISTGVQAVGDGSYVTRARVEERTITLTLDYIFKPGVDHTIEDTREMLYKYAAPGHPITIQVFTDNRSVKIDGHVASFKTDIFEETAESKIEVKCPDPYFYDIDETTITLPVVLSTDAATSTKALLSAVKVPNNGDLPCSITIVASGTTTITPKILYLCTSSVMGITFGADIDKYMTVSGATDRPYYWLYSSDEHYKLFTIGGSDCLYAMQYTNADYRWYKVPKKGDYLVLWAELDDGVEDDGTSAYLKYRQKYVGV